MAATRDLLPGTEAGLQADSPCITR
jgi:hypothetical protein